MCSYTSPYEVPRLGYSASKEAFSFFRYNSSWDKLASDQASLFLSESSSSVLAEQAG